MTKTLVNKSVNEELKQATFIVLVPDEVDLQGDTYDEDEVRKACYSFNKFSRQANLFHVTKTTTFDFAESYLAPVDFTIGDFEVKKGTWLATIQVNSDELWELIKSGDISGLSIGAMASGINLEDE
jgi:DNA adenine methylase